MFRMHLLKIKFSLSTGMSEKWEYNQGEALQSIECTTDYFLSLRLWHLYLHLALSGNQEIVTSHA